MAIIKLARDISEVNKTEWSFSNPTVATNLKGVETPSIVHQLDPHLGKATVSSDDEMGKLRLSRLSSRLNLVLATRIMDGASTHPKS